MTSQPTIFHIMFKATLRISPSKENKIQAFFSQLLLLVTNLKINPSVRKKTLGVFALTCQCLVKH